MNSSLKTKLPVFLQARMSSKRLPGKVLFHLDGKPILAYLLDSLKQCKLMQNICVVTSSDSSDDPIISFCEQQNIEYFRGALEDVSARMLNAATHHQCQAFVRVNGDSPLIVSGIIDTAIQLFNSYDCDLVTNTYPRTFPVGQSVEVVRTSTFEVAYQKMTKPDEFEHVSKYFYNHADKFKIRNLKNSKDFSLYNFAVDTHQDFQLIKRIIHNMKKSHTQYSLNELVQLYKAL